MRLHRYIIRANAMLDTLERDTLDALPVDSRMEFLEQVAVIRGDLNHVDRKLAAFNRIVLDVLVAE